MRWLLLTAFLFVPQLSGAEEVTNTLHRLLLSKANLENRFGIERLECYPFIARIGFTEDQRHLIENCLKTAVTLTRVLEETNRKDLRVVGISDHFLKTGGFDTVLIQAGATHEEILQFLGTPLTQVEQQQFLDKINQAKNFIRKKIKVGELYCSQRISNKDCLQGYQTLAAVMKNTILGDKRWGEIVITDSEFPLENPDALPLRFDGDEEKFRNRLVFRDSGEEWGRRQDLYSTIEERYGDWFRKKLKLTKFICAIELTDQECMQGAGNFYVAAPKLLNHYWSLVTIDKHNTLIQDDFDAHIRFDLSPDEIIKRFSVKPLKQETQANNLLAEKLERRTKNNPSGLRVVCDLKGLRSDLCVKGFQAFFMFMKQTHREYLADRSWETLMWVDGDQLSRVNFALNSGSRKSYIYADANADQEEVARYFMLFGKIVPERDIP